MDPLVLVDHPADAVTAITLNRPAKRNALNLPLIYALTAAVHAASDDPACRVLLLQGAGPAFCAGLDLTEAANPQFQHDSAEGLRALYEAICASPAVTIAAPHGPAMGGGAGLVAACDLAVAADDLQLAYPEVKRGLVAALVTCLLRRQLPDRHVRELVLLGQTVDAPRALALGLVNRVAPAAQLTEASLALAREVLTAAPGAIQRTKRLLDALDALPVSEQLARAMTYHTEARNSAEAAEGLAAFREKRPPRWGHRV